MARKEVNHDEFKDAVKEGVVLVNVTSDGWSPCVALGKAIDEMMFDYPFVDSVDINITTNEKFADEYNINGTPTLFVMKDGEIKKTVGGFVPVSELMELVSQYIYWLIRLLSWKYQVRHKERTQFAFLLYESLFSNEQNKQWPLWPLFTWTLFIANRYCSLLPRNKPIIPQNKLNIFTCIN